MAAKLGLNNREWKQYQDLLAKANKQQREYMLQQAKQY